MAARDAEGLWRKKQLASKEVGGEWPTVKSKKGLKVNSLKSTHLFTISNFLTAYEAKSFIEIAESIGFTHQGSRGPTKGEAYRDNDRVSITDPLLAQNLWDSGLKNVFFDIKLYGKSAVGLNSNIRFYRYNAGQQFGQHIDESVELENGSRTYYTLLVYLSGGSGSKGKIKPDSDNPPSVEPLAGGETVFYDKKHRVFAEVAPLEGMALLHLHGAQCMLHESRQVTKGVKYVLRSDVAFA